jgi:hypothetical protein
LGAPSLPQAPLPSLTFRPLTLVAANLRSHPTSSTKPNKPEGEWGGGHPSILMPVQNRVQVGPNFLEAPGLPQAPLPSLTFRPLTLVLAANLRNHPTFLHRTRQTRRRVGGRSPIHPDAGSEQRTSGAKLLEDTWSSTSSTSFPDFPTSHLGSCCKPEKSSNFPPPNQTNQEEHGGKVIHLS